MRAKLFVLGVLLLAAAPVINMRLREGRTAAAKISRAS